MKYLLTFAGAALVGAGLFFYLTSPSLSAQPLGLAVCTVTETKVAIGHQLATTVVPAGAKSWAVIQQPLNATNTVALSVGGTAVVGSGYTLVNATTSTYAHELRIGFSTDLPTSQAVTARTSTGSSTINVLTCR